MRIPTFADSFQVLLLQAADEGRGQLLFGESAQRAREEVPPFLVGKSFPSVYLEHPLIGSPFLDVTVLLSELEPGTRVDSPAAGEHAALLDWYAGVRAAHHEVSCGFELDTEEPDLPKAAVHFQPRTHTELVEPFCTIVGEPDRARLYLDLAERMPAGWPLSFFGMFRGRKSAPLRVCGYLDYEKKRVCGEDPSYLAEVFRTIGFTAYDSAMLQQVSTLMAIAPGQIDFQFDIYPDGSLGSVFAIDMQFDIERPETVRSKFEGGPGSRVMHALEDYGVADKRWEQAVQSVFARAIPVETETGELGKFAFTLMPQWVKARWADGVLQPSKLYHLVNAKLLDENAKEPARGA